MDLLDFCSPINVVPSVSSCAFAMDNQTLIDKLWVYKSLTMTCSQPCKWMSEMETKRFRFMGGLFLSRNGGDRLRFKGRALSPDIVIPKEISGSRDLSHFIGEFYESERRKGGSSLRRIMF